MAGPSSSTVAYEKRDRVAWILSVPHAELGELRAEGVIG